MCVGDKTRPIHHPILKPANLPGFLAVARTARTGKAPARENVVVDRQTLSGDRQGSRPLSTDFRDFGPKLAQGPQYSIARVQYGRDARLLPWVVPSEGASVSRSA